MIACLSHPARLITNSNSNSNSSNSSNSSNNINGNNSSNNCSDSSSIRFEAAMTADPGRTREEQRIAIADRPSTSSQLRGRGRLKSLGSLL